MKRFGWLLLLVSLGVNLGLGYRLLKPISHGAVQHADSRTRNSNRGLMQRTNEKWGSRPEDLAGFTTRDSSQWCRIMSRRLDRVTQRLDLEPEQVETFKASNEGAATQLLQQRLRVDQSREHLRQVIARGAMDSDRVRQAARDVAAQQARLDSIITETMLQEMEILNPEQRAEYLHILPFFKGPVQGRGPGRGNRHRGH